MLKRRHNREPLAYIIGSCDFWSLHLTIKKGVLIPRQDTEVLVSAALELIPDSPREQAYRILELGTGSAAIPLALSLERKFIQIITVEKSPSAMAIAKDNILKYQAEVKQQGNHIQLVHGNGFSSIKRVPCTDMIISNPPYIPSGEIPKLQNEVSQWEPSLALDGGEDGLNFYRYLRTTAEILLKEQGVLIFEHGFDQYASILALMEKSDTLSFHKAVKDIEGRDRVMIYKKR